MLPRESETLVVRVPSPAQSFEHICSLAVVTVGRAPRGRGGPAIRLKAVTPTVWEGIFMLLILKIPVLYLAVVVWYAVRAEPKPEFGGDEEVGVRAPLTPCGWDDWKRRRPRPYGFRPRPAGPRLRTTVQFT
jgi:hypothetical protein